MIRSGNTWLIMLAWLLAGAVAAVLAFRSAVAMGDPVPLGVPLPEYPQLFEIIPYEETANASIMERRIPEFMLEFAAEQPDGASPIEHTTNCEFIGYWIGQTYGVETTAFPVEEALKDNVITVSVTHFDQPLDAMQYSAPARREGESVTEYTARLKHELQQKGAVLLDRNEPLPLPLTGYRFEHFEYQRENENGELVSHYLFIGPLAGRVLAMDYMTTPEKHERARLTVMKMIRTFRVDRMLKDTVYEHDPEYIALNELDEPST